MSTNTGVAPPCEIVLPVAIKVKGVVMTSSPAPTPTASSARRSASVPDATPTPYSQPQ